MDKFKKIIEVIKKKKIIIILSVLAVILIIAIIRISGISLGMNKAQKEYEELSATVEHRKIEGADTKEIVIETDETMADTDSKDPETVAKETDNKSRFKELIRQNPDFAAWLYIPDTKIDYPVMYRKEDPNYYLHRSFYGEYNDNGAIYIGVGSDLESDNIMIHGHHLNNGSMFGELTNYKTEEFYKQHPVVYFDTVEKNGEYDVVAVCRERVYEEEEKNVFKYYKYGGKLSKEDYDYYVNQVKKDSLYDTGITPEYGQQLLTLSTCSYFTENGSGRFIVVAARRNKD